MVKLELEITDIDYNALLERYLPEMAEKLRAGGNPLGSLLGGPLGRSMLERMPTATKEKMTAELLNSSAPRLTPKLEEFAAQNGAPLRVASLRAVAVHREGET